MLLSSCILVHGSCLFCHPQKTNDEATPARKESVHVERQKTKLESLVYCLKPNEEDRLGFFATNDPEKLYTMHSQGKVDKERFVPYQQSRGEDEFMRREQGRIDEPITEAVPRGRAYIVIDDEESSFR